MGDGADDFERRAERELELEGVVDAEYSAELVPTGGAPATLFRTDDPGEVVARATQVANALSAVLKAKKLTVKIGNREHVVVEGWALCGSMLGVFPVVDWTRKLEDGWEARAEARTLSGAVVGAAEGQCTRAEKEWGPNPTRGKPRDDYALRSMAQTRAISKALRLPLGFIVTLAGYDATPAEEMHDEPAQPPKPFDPETDLMPSGVSPQNAAKVLVEIEPTVEWGDVLAQVEPGWRELKGAKSDDFWRRVANAATVMSNIAPAGTLPPDSGQIKDAFAFAFHGLVIEVVYKETPPPEPPEKSDAALSPEQQKQAEEALKKNDDPEFGENA